MWLRLCHTFSYPEVVIWWKVGPWIMIILWCPSGSCPDSGGSPGRGSGPFACRVPTGEWCFPGILRCLRALHFGGSWQTAGRLVYSPDCITTYNLGQQVQLCFCTFEISKRIHAFITFPIDYCNSLYSCLNQFNLSKLKLVQNQSPNSTYFTIPTVVTCILLEIILKC